MDQFEYREQLRNMPMAELLTELQHVRDHLAGRSRPDWSQYRGLTDDWQARQLLAELGDRQLSLELG